MRVGVIVPARAPVPFLAEALDSVLSQDRAPERVVVVDHGAVGGFAVPEGVEVVGVDDAGGGPARARDAGVAALADCDWIALLDADDAWERGKLAAQVAAVDARSDTAVCFGRAEVVDERGMATGERLPELSAGVHAASELLPALYERNAIPASSALMRRDALEAVGGFAPRPPLPAASDWDLWLRLAEAGHVFACVPDARVRYRRHPGGLTADVSRLAEAGLRIHEKFAHVVDSAVARRAQARDLETLARGRIRERRYADARSALAKAAELGKPAPRERALRIAAAIPGVRAALGRRAPYR